MATAGRHHLEFAPRATRELRKLPRRDRDAIFAKLQDLATIPTPGNLDLAPLKRRPPWWRLRVGDFRVLFRWLAPEDMRRLVLKHGVPDGQTGFYIARVVNKADVDRAVDKLELNG